VKCGKENIDTMKEWKGERKGRKEENRRREENHKRK
jgi:hypothetical protein